MLDLTKPVQTRNGRNVRILCTDRKHTDRPIVALVEGEYGSDDLLSYTQCGKLNPYQPHMDLVNIPQRHKHADCIIAWANGAQIQFYSNSIEEWEDVSRPLWDAGKQYRVKPE